MMSRATRRLEKSLPAASDAASQGEIGSVKHNATGRPTQHESCGRDWKVAILRAALCYGRPRNLPMRAAASASYSERAAFKQNRPRRLRDGADEQVKAARTAAAGLLEVTGGRIALVSCSFEGFGNGFYSVVGRKGVIE
jgi:hypothetical protein